MAVQQPTHAVERAVPADIPTRREYDDEDDATLDDELCDAIDAAQTVGNDYLAQVLANELGSHYYKTR
ncbi:hypothetical protein [Halosimplex halobium]|uniref:hypothetical protein n=1 Tax=Halosimplex halobium TaxID=3396618 RepID=UPI003F565D6E